MKHKAQKALDDISNTLYTTDYVEHIKCQSYPIMEDEQAVIKQLLDCQIPYNYLQMLCVVVKENIDRLEKKARKFEREGKFSDLAVYSQVIEQHKQIIEVLHKQKEMWEKERMLKTIEELDGELCNYCPCTEYGDAKVNTGPWNLCEGCACDKAYEKYLEYNQDEEEEE